MPGGIFFISENSLINTTDFPGKKVIPRFYGKYMKISCFLISFDYNIYHETKN